MDMPEPRRRVRLVLADDHRLVREGLRTILEANGCAVEGEAGDGREAVRLCEHLQPDVALLVLAMPCLNGIDAAREIARQAPGTKTILLTMHSSESCILAGLRAGVTGYVLKQDAAAAIVQAIEAVLRDETYISAGVSRSVIEAYLTHWTRPTVRLSPRERKVLRLIAEGHNVDVIDVLLGISVGTAEAHRTRIMSKLDIHEVAGLVRYAIANHLVAVKASLSH